MNNYLAKWSKGKAEHYVGAGMLQPVMNTETSAITALHDSISLVFHIDSAGTGNFTYRDKIIFDWQIPHQRINYMQTGRTIRCIIDN